MAYIAYEGADDSANHVALSYLLSSWADLAA